MRPLSRLVFFPVVMSVLALAAGVQSRVPIDSGRPALGLALRRLNTTATFMMATAHPDDENNAVLAWVSRGLGARTVVVSATRGDGGQNEIGPELFDALAALRSEELLAAHRMDGAEQYFTRAVDFGYSFSVEETYEKWGKEEVIRDFVRHMRLLRPDVVVAMRPGGGGGGQHHQASARLAREAFQAAGDPARYPDQIAEGLRPWQPKKLYFTAARGGRGEPVPEGKQLLDIATESYDALLGRTYAEAGSEARSMHKCQGFGQLLVLPGQAGIARYELVDAVDPSWLGRDESSPFDGIDVSVGGLAHYGAEAGSRIAAIAEDIRGAQDAYGRGDDARVVTLLVSGLERVRAARRTQLPFELEFRLEQKERQFEEALLIAHAVRIETLADDGLVVPGQELKIDVRFASRAGLSATLTHMTIAGLKGRADGVKDPTPRSSGPTAAGVVTGIMGNRTVPADAELTGVHWRRLPDVARYEYRADVPFGVPFPPTPFRAQLTMDLSGAEVTVDRPLEYRYEGTIFSGEKRMELNVVPRLAVTLTPEVAIIPLQAKGRELTVSVTNSGRSAGKGEVRLEPPEGWTATPAVAPVHFMREDEAQTIRFTVSPPRGVKPGDYRVRAVATMDGEPYDRGYQVVEYPHIQRRHLIHESAASLKVLDVRIAPRRTVGYVMGVGDQVPPAIEQLGARVVMLGPDDLSAGDLARFDAIVTGVRAYERRADLRAHNERLIEYVRRGGTLIVQYNKFEFNAAQYAPYPAKVSSDRITDENSPVRLLAPEHPVFTGPNPIGEDDWTGWVQERGLYFLGDRDRRYSDLVELEDPFEFNKGPKRGALVEARVGTGRWIYLGLGLWRQLPAGTPGAYALMANLLSLPPAR